MEMELSTQEIYSHNLIVLLNRQDFVRLVMLLSQQAVKPLARAPTLILHSNTQLYSLNRSEMLSGNFNLDQISEEEEQLI